MSIYQGVNGINREIKQIFQGVGGVNHEIKERWEGVSGVNSKVFSSDLAYPVLYDSGKENMLVTGGWVNYTGKFYTDDPIVKESESVLCSSVWNNWGNQETSGMRTNKPIILANLGSHSIIKADVELLTSTGLFRCYFDVDPNNYTSQNYFADIPSGIGRKILTFPLMQYTLTQPTYLFLNAISASNTKQASMRIYKVWME